MPSRTRIWSTPSSTTTRRRRSTRSCARCRAAAAGIKPGAPDPARTGEGRGVSDRPPSWGIEPVPERLRTLSALDNGMLWSSLGLSLLVLVAGTFLVPALSLPQALLAIVVGGVFGNVLLGLAAFIGADARVP